MNMQYRSYYENSPRHQALIEMMKEFGISQGNLSYSEAIEKYYNWSHKGVREPQVKLFGEYSFRSEGYELLTNKELELMGDVFRMYKPKKLFSGVSMYCKVFGGFEIGIGKGAIIRPGDIIWEVKGLDAMTVIQMANHVSDALKISVKAYDVRGMKISQ